MNAALQWLNNLDPVVQKIVYAAAGLVLFAFVAHLIARRRGRVGGTLSPELQASLDKVRLQKEEVQKLAEQIIATSSTARITGYSIVRQVEAVFGDAQASSEAAVELVKARAAQKGGNAIINLQTQPAGGGKWVVRGDAVLVKALKPLWGLGR